MAWLESPNGLGAIARISNSLTEVKQNIQNLPAPFLVHISRSHFESGGDGVSARGRDFGRHWRSEVFDALEDWQPGAVARQNASQLPVADTGASTSAAQMSGQFRAERSVRVFV